MYLNFNFFTEKNSNLFSNQALIVLGLVIEIKHPKTTNWLFDMNFPTSEPRSGFYSERFDIYIEYFQKLAPTDAEKREKLEAAALIPGDLHVAGAEADKERDGLHPLWWHVG